MANPDAVAWSIVLIFIISVLIGLCRELICWWSKINERLKVLYEIRDLLVRLNARGEVRGPGEGKVIDVEISDDG